MRLMPKCVLLKGIIVVSMDFLHRPNAATLRTERR